MPKRFLPIPAGTPPDQMLAVINKNFAELDNENVKKLFYDSNGVPSIFIGIDQNQHSVIKVAKSGVDVTTATNEQLAFLSSRNTLQVIDILTTTIASDTISPGNTTRTATVDLTSYNLTVTPLIFAFYTTGGAPVSLGSAPFGGTVIEFVGTAGTLTAFSLLSTNHTASTASFSRKFVNNQSSGSLTVPQYNLMFMVCAQTAS